MWLCMCSQGFTCNALWLIYCLLQYLRPACDLIDADIFCNYFIATPEKFYMKWQTYPAFLVCGHTYLFNSLIKQVLIVSVWMAQFRNHRTRAAVPVEKNIKSACFGSAQMISWYSVQRDFYLGILEYWKGYVCSWERHSCVVPTCGICKAV